LEKVKEEGKKKARSVKLKGREESELHVRARANIHMKKEEKSKEKKNSTKKGVEGGGERGGTRAKAPRP